MAVWAAVLDGINDRATIASVTTSNNIDAEAVITFNSLNGGAILSDGGVANFFRYNAGTLRFRCLGFLGSSMSFTPVIGQKYTLGAALRPNGVELFVDGSSIGTSNGSPTGMLINTIGFFNSSFYLGCTIERLTVTDNTTPANSFDLYNDVIAGSSVDWPDKTANARNATLADTATDGNQWLEFGGVSAGAECDISFDISPVEFSLTASATLPQPVANVSFDITPVEFALSVSASLPQPSCDISFDVSPVEFTIDASTAQSSPVSDIYFTIDPVYFSMDASATLPQPVCGIEFDIPPTEFSCYAETVVPQPIAGIYFEIEPAEFSLSAEASMPSPISDIEFSIDPVQLTLYVSANGAINNIILPVGSLITPKATSNIITLPKTSNLIKL